MLSGELRGKVGVAPGTTTLYIPAGLGQDPSVLTYEQYLAADIQLRRDSLIWDRIGTIASASLAGLALLAAVSAWVRTGRLEAVRK